MRIGRRQVLLGAAGTLGASVLGAQAWSMGPGARAWQDGAVAAIVRAHVPDARVGDANMAAFAREFLARTPGSVDGLLAARTLLAPVRGTLPRAIEGRLRKLETRVVGLFLMASDYYHPDRRSEVVTFVAYPDPYTASCSNPLARFDFPPVSQA